MSEPLWIHLDRLEDNIRTGPETLNTKLSRPLKAKAMTLTKETLDRLEALLAKATPGPWVVVQNINGPVMVWEELGHFPVCSVAIGRLEQDNAELITAAINALPALIAAARSGIADPELDAERVVGRFVYERVSRLMNAKPDTPEGRELAYLAELIGCVEEYGATGKEDGSAWDGDHFGIAERVGVEEAWLPIVLCPTDGVDRALRLPDGREVVGNFDSRSLGRNDWQIRSVAYHNPARIIGQRGGVDQWSSPYDTFLISSLPEGVYPTHFWPNDTVYGMAEPTPLAEDDGPITESATLRQDQAKQDDGVISLSMGGMADPSDQAKQEGE